MLLTFLGTRANLSITSATHRRHSALLVESSDIRLLIDCGTDWLNQLGQLKPDRVLLTHAHNDHAGGLTAPLPVPVHATAATWRALPALADDPLAFTCRELSPLAFGPLRAMPIPLPHSQRSPAVCWSLANQQQQILYAPDSAGPPGVAIPDGIDLYIGDGSSFSADLLRVEEGIICGHAPITSQLEWCRSVGIAEAIFTHCGSEILADEPASAEHLARLAQAFAVPARFARDSLQIRPGEARQENPAGTG